MPLDCVVSFWREEGGTLKCEERWWAAAEGAIEDGFASVVATAIGARDSLGLAP